MNIDEEILSRRLLRQLNSYCNKLTSKFNHRIQRAVKEVSYGLLAKNSAMLSEIARSLNEPRDIRVTMNRLSFNLAESAFFAELEINHMKMIRDVLDADTIVVIDAGDVCKPHARKLEGLTFVYDGSEKREVRGYPLLISVAVKHGRDTVLPILIRLFSRLEPEYLSDNIVTDTFIHQVLGMCGTEPRYVFDSGFSGIEQLKRLENMGISYIVRGKDRSVTIDGGSLVMLFSWASEKHLPYSTTIVSIQNGNDVRQTAWYAVENITIEEYAIRCIIMRIEGHGICVLYTNRKIGVRKLAHFGADIISDYGHRWSIEEYNRFKKQIFDFENIRLQSLQSMKNFVAIVTVSSGFIAHIGFLRKSLSRMTEKLIELGIPIREEVRFPHYRIAAGIKRVWEARRKTVFQFKRRHKAEPSPMPLLEFPDDKP